MANAQGMVDKLYTAFSQLSPEMKNQVADIAMRGAGSQMTPANRARAMDLLSQNGKYAEMQMQRAGVQMPSSYEPEVGSAHNFNVLEGVDRLMRNSERAAPAQSAPAPAPKAPAVGKRAGDRAQVNDGERQTVEAQPPTRRSEANTRTAENDPTGRGARMMDEMQTVNRSAGDKDVDDTSLAGKLAGAAAGGVAAYIVYRAYKNSTRPFIADEKGNVLGEASPADVKNLPMLEDKSSSRAESRAMTPRPQAVEGEEVVGRSLRGPIIDGEFSEVPETRQVTQQRPIADASASPDSGDRVPAMANPSNDRQITGPNYNPQEKMIQDAQRGASGIDATIARSMEGPETGGPTSSGLNKNRKLMNARTPRPRIQFR